MYLDVIRSRPTAYSEVTIQHNHFFFGGAAQRGLWPPHLRGFSRSHTTDAGQSVGLLWTSDQLVAETST